MNKSGPPQKKKLMPEAEKHIRKIRSTMEKKKRDLLNMTGQQLAKLFKKN